MSLDINDLRICTNVLFGYKDEKKTNNIIYQSDKDNPGRLERGRKVIEIVRPSGDGTDSNVRFNNWISTETDLYLENYGTDNFKFFLIITTVIKTIKAPGYWSNSSPTVTGKIKNNSQLDMQLNCRILGRLAFEDFENPNNTEPAEDDRLFTGKTLSLKFKYGNVNDEFLESRGKFGQKEKEKEKRPIIFIVPQKTDCDFEFSSSYIQVKGNLPKIDVWTILEINASLKKNSSPIK